jgi:hypothetical protein
MDKLSIYDVITLRDLVEELTKKHTAEEIIEAAEKMAVVK